MGTDEDGERRRTEKWREDGEKDTQHQESSWFLMHYIEKQVTPFSHYATLLPVPGKILPTFQLNLSLHLLYKMAEVSRGRVNPPY